MRISTVEDVRSGDIVVLECKGRRTYHVIIHDKDNGYGMEQITQAQYVATYNVVERTENEAV